MHKLSRGVVDYVIMQIAQVAFIHPAISPNLATALRQGVGLAGPSD